MEKIPHTPLQRALQWISLLLLVGTFVYLALAWQQIPDQVPMHYNGRGEITRWGGKGNVLIFPIFMAAMSIPMLLLEHYPSVWNMSGKAYKVDPAATIQATRTLMIGFRAALLACGFLTTLYNAQALPLPPWYLAVTLAMLFGPMASYFVRVYRIGRPKQDR